MIYLFFLSFLFNSSTWASAETLSCEFGDKKVEASPLAHDGTVEPFRANLDPYLLFMNVRNGFIEYLKIQNPLTKISAATFSYASATNLDLILVEGEKETRLSCKITTN